MKLHFSSLLKNKAIYFPLILLLFLCSSCEDREELAGSEKYYYDLAGWLQSEMGHLSTTKPLVKKITMLAGETENLETNSVDWSKELALFMKADLNKPAYKNSYTTDRPDSTTVVYTLKPTENLTLQQLTVHYDDLGQLPVQIDGSFESVNKLYESKRSFRLNIAEGHLTAYHVHGYQKLVMMDKRPFDIQVSIK